MKKRFSINARTPGFSLCSAMVAALLAGCAGQPPLASAGAPPRAGSSSDEGLASAASTDKVLARAEARVAKAPNNASARADLAQLYLAAGRFDSAATTLEDAVSLGDKTPRTGLGLALAYIGSDRKDQALGVLGQWRDQIPAGDFGLAVALAGRPAQGVAILSDTLRGGENTPKVRQNLAYAYALDGRWAESRVIAAQDVPADQLDARIGEWASRVRPEQARERVAAMLGAPTVADPGQPVALALASADHAPRMAAAEVPAATPVGELPAVAAGESFADAAPPSEPAFALAAPIPAAYTAPAPVKQAPEKQARGTSIERAFAPLARVEAPRAKGPAHVVQLGSFSTKEGAQRAWGIFQRRDARLRDHTLRITEAEVAGRRYFRVAAVGFDRGSAETMCSTVKQRGGGCLAYAEGRQIPGALLTGSGPLKARR